MEHDEARAAAPLTALPGLPGEAAEWKWGDGEMDGATGKLGKNMGYK